LHLWGWAVTVTLVLIAFIKRKAIEAIGDAVAKAAKEKFFRWFSKNLPHQKTTNEKAYRDTSLGGKGGDAEVGGSGIAIGGPGGHGGKHGAGGDGGNAKVQGDGVAAGGEGGSAGDDGVWRPPARSGYEVYLHKMGETLDPFLKQFGRGGAGPGYTEKLRIIEQLRADYFQSYSIRPESILENINAVPLSNLNEKLEAMNESWRARIINGQYEFFVLSKPQ
jgi:hypothetical protein